MRGFSVFLGHNYDMDFDCELKLNAKRVICHSTEGGFDLTPSLVMSIVALVVTGLIAIINYTAVERRNKNDIVRNAITDLTTGKIAEARNSVSKWTIIDESSQNVWYEDYAHNYFELCWAYQRGSAARKVWKEGQSDHAHGLDNLQFHLKQIAITVHQYHNHIANRIDNDLDDSHIWDVVGAEMAQDVRDFGIPDPNSNESYREYFEQLAKARKEKLKRSRDFN